MLIPSPKSFQFEALYSYVEKILFCVVKDDVESEMLLLNYPNIKFKINLTITSCTINSYLIYLFDFKNFRAMGFLQQKLPSCWKNSIAVTIAISLLLYSWPLL